MKKYIICKILGHKWQWMWNYWTYNPKGVDFQGQKCSRCGEVRCNKINPRVRQHKATKIKQPYTPEEIQKNDSSNNTMKKLTFTIIDLAKLLIPIRKRFPLWFKKPKEKADLAKMRKALKTMKFQPPTSGNSYYIGIDTHTNPKE